MMTGMPDMRRRTPEPPAGAPEIQFKPGMANELLQELAPLLAEEGIDVDNIDVSDPDTLQRALNRAIERHNMAMFTPVGHARELAAVTMRLAAEAIADGDTALATAVLDQAQPESPDGQAATVAGCTGLTLGLLDQWLSGHDASAPPGLATMTRLPAGHWTGERAALDILTLARKGRAFAALDALIARQGGQHVLYGSALALAAALQAWSRHAGTPSSTWRVPSFAKPIRSQPSVASVATMAGIRRRTVGPVGVDTASHGVSIAVNLTALPSGVLTTMRRRRALRRARSPARRQRTGWCARPCSGCRWSWRRLRWR